jgi:phosphatidylglycerol---prolipoprotein diacylglyceryl transferase
MSHIHIRVIEVWPDVFAFFFLLSIATAVVAVYLFGQIRGIDPVRWNFYQLVAVGVGLLGSKLYMLRGGEFGAVLGGGGLPHATGMNLLGGVLAGALAVYLLRYLQRSKDPIFDAWAWLVPVAVMVGRIGCFAGGCCHGEATAIPWATTYPAPALPLLHQRSDGLLSLAHSTSLPVHPVPLYEFILLLLLLQVVRKAAPRLQRSSLFLVTVGGYSLVRFSMEFWRYGGATLGPLKVVQWGLIVVALGCAVWFWRRERAVVVAPSNPRPAWGAQVALLTAVVVAGFWFDPLERASLLIGAAPWAGHLAQRAGQWLGRRYAIPAPAILSSGVVLTMLASWTPLYNKPGGRKDINRQSVRLSGGGGMGEENYADGCQAPPVSYSDRFVAMQARASYKYEYLEGSFIDLGFDYSRLKVARYKGPEEGFDSNDQYVGTMLEHGARAPYSIWGLGPTVMWDYYWGAVGAGLQVMNSDELGESMGPSLYLRGGPSDVFFAEFGFGQAEQPTMAYGGIRFGLGAALGPAAKLKVGASRLGIYVEPHFKLDFDSARLVLMPVATFGGDQGSFYFGGAAALEFDVGGD